MSEAQVITKLRHTLVELYPYEMDARRVVHDAAINKSMIDFSSSAVNRWQAILDQANSERKIRNLLTVVQSEYSDHPGLKSAIAVYENFVSISGETDTPVIPTSFISERRPDNPEIFQGRQKLLEKLVHRLTRSTNRVLNVSHSFAITGLPGIGKTTLAAAVSYHPTIESHFEGVLWANLGKQADVTRILYHWAEELQIDLAQRESTKRFADAIRAAIGRRQFLLIIDDVWDFELINSLRYGNPNCFYLITTRIDEIAIKFCGGVAKQIFKLPDLSTTDAYRLLRRFAQKACDAEPTLAKALVEKAGGLPLTIELLGGYLADPTHSYFKELRQRAIEELGDPVQRLKLAFRRIASNDARYITLQQTVDLSLEGLPTNLQNLFYQLAVFAPKPEYFDLSAAYAILGVQPGDLAKLAAHNLIELDPSERLAIHQTLSAVAKVGIEGKAGELNYKYYCQLHLTYYLNQLKNKQSQDYWLIESVFGQLRWAAQTSVEPVIQALRSYFWDQEISVRNRRSIGFLLLELSQLSQTDEISTEELLCYLDFIILFADIFTRRSLIIRIITPMLITSLPDRLRAKLLLYRAGMYGELNQSEHAVSDYKEANKILFGLLAESEPIGEDYKLFAQANLGLGTFFTTSAEQSAGIERQSLLTEALECHEKAINAAEKYEQDKILQARIYSELGVTHALLRYWRKAQICYEKSLTYLQPELESSESFYPRVLENAGYTHWLHGQYLEGKSKKAKASKAYQQAYKLTQQEIEYLDRIVDEAEGLVQAHINAGDYLTAIHRCNYDLSTSAPEKAIAHWQRAWQIATSLGIAGYEQEAYEKLTQYQSEQVK